MRRHVHHRRGFALADAIIGGVILSLGLVTLLGLSGRALKQSQRGEQALIASSLIDQLLGTVLAEGPDRFPKFYDTSGQFEAPFDQYFYDIIIEDEGEGNPYRVTVFVRSDAGNEFSTETLISAREGDDPDPIRVPPEIIDREARHDQLEENTE